MKKWLAVILALSLCAVLLSACSGGQPEEFQVMTNANQYGSTQQSVQVTPYTAPAAQEYDFDSGDYDPASEEGVLDTVEEENAGYQAGQSNAAPVAAAPQGGSQYAGATPVVIDPIDKPTPTPAPVLTIESYQVYDATKVGLSFEGPVGWTVDDSASDAYTIINPDPSVDYPASLTIRKISISANYTQAQLKTQVNEMLNALKERYSKFSPSKTDTRDLLGATGVYANFTGVEKDTGAAVWGRVHCVSLNKTLYILEMYTPSVYSEVYKDTLYSRFRRTVKITR